MHLAKIFEKGWVMSGRSCHWRDSIRIYTRIKSYIRVYIRYTRICYRVNDMKSHS